MSTLAKYAHLSREPDPVAGRRLAREAYHHTGLVLIDPGWLQSWADRQQLIMLAEKIHGKRKIGEC